MKWQVKAFFVLLLIPIAALAQQQTQSQAGAVPPGPTMVVRSVLEDQNLSEQFNLIQFVLEFAPGAWTPMHSHGGMVLITVLEGEVTYRLADGTETVYAVGEMWVEYPGEVGAAGNAGEVPARLVVSALLPEGAELTTLHHIME